VRELSDRERILAFMRELGRAARGPSSIYFTGGSTAVLHGWREATMDIDLRLEPDRDEPLRAIADLKDRLDVNVELESPEDFLPVTRDWRERSPFIATHGSLGFHHFDLRARAAVSPRLHRYPALSRTALERALEASRGPRPPDRAGERETP
jgi:hypothetical protein